MGPEQSNGHTSLCLTIEQWPNTSISKTNLVEQIINTEHIGKKNSRHRHTICLTDRIKTQMFVSWASCGNSVLNSWKQSGICSAALKMIPNPQRHTGCGNSVLNSWKKSGTGSSALKSDPRKPQRRTSLPLDRENIDL